MSPQEIKNKTFEKAVFGGYEMAAVDEFLDEIYVAFGELAKENASLKAKIKVVASKIEDYRKDENVMSQTLVAAQKTGLQIENDAKMRSERMISDAEIKATKLIHDANAQIENEEEKLIKAKISTAQYFEDMRNLCTKQLGFLDYLSENNVIGKEAQAQPAAPKAAAVPDISAEIDSIAVDEDADTKLFRPVDVKGFNLNDLR